MCSRRFASPPQAIEAYHRRQVPADASFTDEAGATLGWRWSALESVGVYVPGGTASLSELGVDECHTRESGRRWPHRMVTPASGGQIPPLILAAAKIAGVTEIYRAGGAQAIAALAYGTESIAPVDKIVLHEPAPARRMGGATGQGFARDLHQAGPHEYPGFPARRQPADRDAAEDLP